MLASFSGSLALLLGLAVLLLPLLATELSRPGDTGWGAVILLLGLTLVTSADRLAGAPMLAVLCGTLVVSRLSLEVGRGRWRQLSEEEQRRLWSGERWLDSVAGLISAFGLLVSRLLTAVRGLREWLQERRQRRPVGKKWVRPETADASSPGEPPATATEEEGGRQQATEDTGQDR
jgi:hypothetical protein